MKTNFVNAPVAGLRLGLVVLSLLTCVVSEAAPFRDWFDATDRYGKAVRVWGEGDEYAAAFEAADGHTIAFNISADCYEYQRQLADGSLVGAGIFLGDEPAQAAALAAIPLHLRDTSEKAHEETQARYRRLRVDTGDEARWETLKAERRAEAEIREREKKGEKVSFQHPGRTTKGVVVGLTIAVDFPILDEQGRRTGSLREQFSPDLTLDDIDEVMNAETIVRNKESCYESVRKFFEGTSAGALSYTNVILGWVEVPHPRDYYDKPDTDAESCSRALIADVFDVLKARDDYEEVIEPQLKTVSYFPDATNFRAVNVLFAGTAAKNWSKGLWANQSSLQSAQYNKLLVNVDGQNRHFLSYMITPLGSQLAPGTICHENGHMICSFTDLYVYDANAKGSGVGRWSPMCSHGGYASQNFDAYLRCAAGWVTPKMIPTDGQAHVLTVSNDVSDVWKYVNPNNTKEYYLIENRQNKERDQFLKGSGILIWRCKEDGNNKYPTTTSVATFKNYGNAVYRKANNELSLEQADGNYLLENSSGALGDATDPWYAGVAAANFRGYFCSETIPCARWTDGTAAGLTLSQFSENGDVMTFTAGETFASLPDAVPTVTIRDQANEVRNEVFAGEPLTVLAQIENNGLADLAAAAACPVTVTLLRADGTFLATVADLTVDADVAPLRSGDLVLRPCAALSGLEPGSYVLRATVNAGRTVEEQNYDNDSADFPFVVWPRPAASEALNALGFTVENDAVAPWSAALSQKDGSVYLTSEPVGAGQTTSIRMTVSGPGYLYFDFRCCKGSTLKAYVDGEKEYSYSSKSTKLTWMTNNELELPGNGPHTVEWRYTQASEVDLTNLTSSFCANIRNVEFEPPVGISEEPSYDFTNSVVSVECLPDETTKASIRVIDADGSVVSDETRPVSGDRVVHFAVPGAASAGLTPGRQYLYELSLVGEDPESSFVMTNVLAMGNIRGADFDWVSTTSGKGGEVWNVLGGAWTPQLPCARDTDGKAMASLKGDAVENFDFDQPISNRVVTVNTRLRLETALDADSLPNDFGADAAETAVTVVRTESGALAWYCYTADGWTPLVGHAPALRLDYTVSVELDQTRSPALARYLVSRDGMYFLPLSDAQGNVWLPTAGTSRKVSGVTLSGGSAVFRELNVTEVDPSLFEGENGAYKSFADAVAAGERTLKLLTNVTIDSAPKGMLILPERGFGDYSARYTAAAAENLLLQYTVGYYWGNSHLAGPLRFPGSWLQANLPEGSKLHYTAANGLPYWQNYILGLDPQDPASLPKLGSVAVDPSSGCATFGLGGDIAPSDCGWNVFYRLDAADAPQGPFKASGDYVIHPTAAAVEIDPADTKKFYKAELYFRPVDSEK